MTEQAVKTIQIKNAGKIGFFGISSYPRSVETIGCELGDRSKILTKDEQAYFEKALDLKEGTLAPHSKWWDDVFNVEFALRLRKDKTNTLVLDTPLNELRYKVAMYSSKIANSETERLKPGISFYIDDVEARAKKELESFNYKFEGMKLILSMSLEEKRSNLRLFGKKDIDTMTENSLGASLAQELEKNPKNFFEVLNDRDLKTKAFIAELLEKKVLTRKGNDYIYGEDTIAGSTEECILYLNDPKNANVKLILGTRLKKLSK